MQPYNLGAAAVDHLKWFEGLKLISNDRVWQGLDISGRVYGPVHMAAQS